MIRIAIFEDADETLKQYKGLFSTTSTAVMYFRSPRLSQEEVQEVREFLPHLIIVDLLMGNSKLDGYTLIRTLQSDERLRDTPIVVVSKFINSSPLGLVEAEEAKTVPGVVAALSKIPTLPSVDVFLQYAKAGEYEPPLASFSAPQPSRRHILRALARRKATWMESFVSHLISRQRALRNLYVIATILSFPLALISASWLGGGDATAPLWSTIAAFGTCSISFLVYVAAILDLLLFPRSQSLAGSNRRAYERLSELDPELHGIIASFKSGIKNLDQSKFELLKAETDAMKLDFSHFLNRHLKRTKRSFFAVIVLSLVCIIVAFSSVYIALYALQPEVATAEPARTSPRGFLGWIVYGLESSLENVTDLGKHSDSSLLAKLSAIIEALTFFFLISVFFSALLDLPREAFEVAPEDLAQEFEQDLLSAASGHSTF